MKERVYYLNHFGLGIEKLFKFLILKLQDYFLNFEIYVSIHKVDNKYQFFGFIIIII
jgi:hypothetical protein